MDILDRAEIERRIDMARGLAAVRKSFIAYSSGEATVPPVIHLAFPATNGDCHVKCGHLKGDSFFVVKAATGFYDNPARGLPSSNGVVLAFSARNGAPLALLRDEGYLTDLRTGLAGAIATRLLWPEGASRVGVVGAGVQARMQLRALRAASPEPFAATIWARSAVAAQQLVSDLAGLDLELSVAPSLERLCRDAQVLITTTPAAEPLIRSEWIAPGTHITAVGADSPGKQELETALVARADILLADSRAQSADHGEFHHAVAAGLLAPERIGEIGAALAAGGIARRKDDISIADLTGLGAQDAAIAGCALAIRGGAE